MEKVEWNTKMVATDQGEMTNFVLDFGNGCTCYINDRTKSLDLQGFSSCLFYFIKIYGRILKGANAKAKANAAQGLPELLKIATNETYEENRKEKHNKNAKYGWYSYDSRFALPVFGDNGEIERYNVFNVAMLVRHNADGKAYLYDIMKIKKETSNLFQSNDLTQ